jgi:ADP-ribosyl-[dinitrogen reductase] hydrolase
MRLAPIPMYYASHPTEAIERAGESSRTTHGAVECIDACRYFVGLIVGALEGVEKEELLSPRFRPGMGPWEENALAPKVQAVADGSFKKKNPPEIRGRGYVIDTLEAVLWAFHHTYSFTQGCLNLVNLGNDAVTTGAVLGQLAGAFYGIDAIPAEWRLKLAMLDKIETLAAGLQVAASRHATCKSDRLGSTTY